MQTPAEPTTPAGYWLACLLPLILGNLLLLVPERHMLAIRSAQRDAIAPGQRLVLAARDFAQSRFDAFALQSQAREQSELQFTQSAELAAYQKRVTQLQAELEMLQSQSQFYQSLQSTTPLEQTSLLEARILGREAVLEETLQWVVTAGKADNVSPEQEVFWGKDWTLDLGKDHALTGDELIRTGHLLLGRIKSVGQTTSVMQPVTSSSFRAIARIIRANGQRTEGDVGSLTGTGHATCRLNYIPSSTPVTTGDFVVTEASSASQVALVGTITKAELTPGQPDWSIEVAPASSRLIPETVSIVQHKQTRVP